MHDAGGSDATGPDPGSRDGNPLLRAPGRPLPGRVAVVGAGTIGPDIAYYLKTALPDIELTLVDVRQQALDAALERVAGYTAKAVARGKLSGRRAAAVSRGLTATLDYGALRDCDWVIEAATENLELKRRIFAQVEEVVDPRALITSNTSSLPAGRIFSGLRHPGRAAGTHFFAPAWRNPIVEVIGWAGAEPATVDYLRWFFCFTGKVPLLAQDVPCFMLDRLFDNWCNEAALCLQTASAAQIDSVAAEFVQAGPFFVLNLANGNPIIIETNTVQADAEGEHYRPAPIFASVERWRTVAPGHRVEVPASAGAAVRDRLLGVYLSQSVDIVDRRIGESTDLDLGARLALGFRQGPLELLAALGEAESDRILARFVAERPGMPTRRQPFAAYGRFLRHLLVDTVGAVKVITLRRPEALNALHDGMTDEILAVIRAHENDGATAGFVIVGYGTRAFCAGADIGRFPDLLGNADAAAGYARDCSRLLLHLDSMTKPVVAAINGLALGGGLELAMRCHALVAVRGASLQFPEIMLGILPGLGGLVVPYRRWPAAAATFHGMIRRGDRLDADRAAALGIVGALTDDYPSLVAAAVAQVAALGSAMPAIGQRCPALAPLEPVEPVAADGARLSAEVVAIIDDAIAAAAAATTLPEALEIGYRAFGRSACTAAAREGIAAFQARRPPDFGRTG